MNTPRDIDRLMQQTQRYGYEDGFWDMGMGGFSLLAGFISAIQALAPRDLLPGPFADIAGLLLLIGGAFAITWIINRLKSNVTFPRTGYVNYERKEPGRLVQLVALALAAAALAAGMVVVSRYTLNLTVIFGIALLGAFGFVAYRTRLWRYLLWGLWCFALGLIITTLPLTRDQGSALFFVGGGLGMIVSGLITWHRYNQSAPRSRETNDGAAS
jgi:hypothetical protein